MNPESAHRSGHIQILLSIRLYLNIATTVKKTKKFSILRFLSYL